MAPLTTFDPGLCPACWFDTGTAELIGWFDQDLVTCISSGAGQEYIARGGMVFGGNALTERSDVAYEYEAEGGLVFSGEAETSGGPVEETRGAWSVYKRRRKLRLPQLELPLSVDYDYVAEGGLVFSGMAGTRHVQAPAIVRRRYIGRGGLRACGGEAITSAHRTQHRASVGDGELPAWTGTAITYPRCIPGASHLGYIGTGQISQLSGTGATEHGQLSHSHEVGEDGGDPDLRRHRGVVVRGHFGQAVRRGSESIRPEHRHAAGEDQ